MPGKTSSAPTPSDPPIVTTPFPSPSTYDILPQVHALVSRLLPADPTHNPNPIGPKDLVAEASSIKIRIQKARATTEALPDIDRTIEEQGVEIKEIEEQISKLKSVIGELGRRAGHKSEAMEH